MTTVTLRPVSTGYDSGNTLTGGSPLSTILADNSDSTYATSGASGSSAEVKLGTTTLPAGAVTRTIGARIRSSSPAAAQLSVSAYAGGIDNGFVSPIIGLDLLAIDASITTRSAAPSAQFFDQTQIDLLTLLFDTANSGVVIYEVYLDLIYALQPTTAVTAPTGTVTTTSQPTVTLTHTAGSDGGPQAYSQVRVFSAAQYGITGFNPETSAATFDSGIQLGGGTSIPTSPLDNSTTYRAYGRTAQLINGYPHWAEWAFSSFTTSYTLPVIASITATADNTLARQRLVVTRTVMSPTWTGVEVQRSLDGGTTWVFVRGATNVLPPGDVWIGYDYESANGVAAIYRARALTPMFTGPWLTSSGSTVTTTATWLKDLRNTARNRTVRAKTLPSPSRGRAQGEHVVVGRADPVIVSDVRQTTRGTVTFVTMTETAADDLLALTDATVLLLQTPTSHRFGSRYIVIRGELQEIRVTRIAQEQIRYWQATYVEVVAPADVGLVVAGLTWQDVVTSYATWTALIAAVPTWGDLV